MSNTIIQLKSSSSLGNVPNVLFPGELAINYGDGKLYYGNTSNQAVLFDAITEPAGINQEIQFNDSGSFGSSANLKFNSSTKTLTTHDLIVANTLMIITTNNIINVSCSIFSQANLAFSDVNDCNKNPRDGEGGFLSPILYEPIEPSGPVTPGLSINNVLLDPSRRFIKVPEINAKGNLLGFTCYEKSEFIYYIKTKIVDNIIKKKDDFEILSPTTRLPIPIGIITMLNSLFHINSFIDANIDIVARNQESYEQLISPTFYYSYGNLNNNPSYENILFLNDVYQYFTTNGVLLASHFPDDIAFAKHMIRLNVQSYINFLLSNIIDGNNRQELATFFQTKNYFLPFVTFKTDKDGRITTYNIHFENHPYFMPEFREIFTSQEVTNFSNRTERRPGVQTRSGKQTFGDFIGVHHSSKQYTDLYANIRRLYENLGRANREFLSSSSASSSGGSSSGGSKKKKRKTLKKMNKKKKKKTIRKKI